MDSLFFQRAFEHSFESIIITTSKLDEPGPAIVYVNASFCKMTGYSREEVLGLTPRILQGPKSDKDVLLNLKSTLQKGQVFHGITTNYKKNGQEYIVEWTVSPIFDSENVLTNYIAYQRDITQKYHQEKEISRRLKFEMGVASATQLLVQGDTSFSNLAQSLKQMLFFTEFNSVFLLKKEKKNEGNFFSVLIEESTSLGIPVYSQLEIKNSWEKSGLSRWVSDLSTGDPVVGFRGDFPIEEQWFFDRGLEFLVLFPISIRGEFQFVIGWENHYKPENIKDGDILLFRTVTHWVESFLNRKKDLEELTLHRDKLKLLVEEQVKDILKAKEEAESANKLKSEFLAKISHELRTPLNSILGFSKLINLDSPTPEDKKYLDYIYNSGNHLLKLINEILDLSKIEAGKMEFLIQAFSIEPTIEAVQHMLTPQAKKKRVEIVSTNLLKKDRMVNADRKRTQQVLLNLLSNAIHFSPEQGIVQIDWKEHKDGKFLVISIQDQGPGIPKEEQASLFQNFSQIKSQANSPYPEAGTGLGLAISKKLVEFQSGWMELESEKGRGATFRVFLPFEEV